jgi:formyltetrahydrofolate deformylase
MSSKKANNAVIRIHCPDKEGIIASVTNFIKEHNGNVVALDQHVDIADNHFFMRVEWEMESFQLSFDEVKKHFQQKIADLFQMHWTLDSTYHSPRMALFVSRLSHCIYDLLARFQANELDVDIPVIISNHLELKHIAEQFGIEFHHFPITKENKKEQEEKELILLKEKGVDFVVLARYMQIISPEFIKSYPNKIINIHHSFLPAFAGAKPYHAAYERGVKIIGATSHYVTENLDAGPIIDQDIIRISHNDSIKSLVQKGKDIEKIVLSRAVKAHVNRKTLVYKNRTIIFD